MSRYRMSLIMVVIGLAAIQGLAAGCPFEISIPPNLQQDALKILDMHSGVGEGCPQLHFQRPSGQAGLIPWGDHPG